MGRKAFVEVEDVESFIRRYAEEHLQVPGPVVIQQHFQGGFLGRYSQIIENWKKENQTFLEAKKIQRDSMPFLNTAEFRKGLASAITPFVIQHIGETVEKSIEILKAERNEALNESTILAKENEELRSALEKATAEIADLKEIHAHKLAELSRSYEEKLTSMNNELAKLRDMIQQTLATQDKKIEANKKDIEATKKDVEAAVDLFSALGTKDIKVPQD